MINLVFLLVGFLLGWIKFAPDSPEQIERKYEEIKKFIENKTKPKVDLGTVKRPTPEQNYLRDHPKIKEDEDATDKLIRDTIKREGI